jgi:hypothetical protein
LSSVALAKEELSSVALAKEEFCDCELRIVDYGLKKNPNRAKGELGGAKSEIRNFPLNPQSAIRNPQSYII